jgi:hypothetical protein
VPVTVLCDPETGAVDLLESVETACVPEPGLAVLAAPEPVAISVLLLDAEPVGEETPLPPLHLVERVLGFSLLPYVTLFQSLKPRE